MSSDSLQETMSSEAGNRYCLTPINMVPNGPPHLGHISGPLLRMDVLRRHLLRLGADVVFVTTTDAHETHVAVKALELGLSPHEVANKFHDQIDRDLASLDIDYDALVNPLDPKWAPVYTEVTSAMMAALKAADACVLKEERLPVRTDNSDYVLGGWLAGNCPNCGASLVSFFCENCGEQTTPSELDSPHHRIDDVALEWVSVRSLFLTLPSGELLRNRWHRMSMRRDFREMAHRYLAKNGPIFRLSIPDTWGEPCVADGLPDGHVTFSYSLALVAAQILSGEVYKSLTGSSHNPFEAGSDVTIVSSFGADNAIPMLVGVLGLGVAQPIFRPPDYYLVNYFYTLAGEKFSTNKQHAIWAADICQKSSLSTDLFRAFMVRVNPEYELVDFGIDHFLQTSNSLIRRTRQGIEEAFELVKVPESSFGPIPDDVSRRLQKSLQRQCMAMALDDFCLSDILTPIDAWLNAGPALRGRCAAASYWWLKAFALISYPVMPKLGIWLWRQLGHTGSPNGHHFFRVEAVDLNITSMPLGNEINLEDLSAVLPERLRSKNGSA